MTTAIGIGAHVYSNPVMGGGGAQTFTEILNEPFTWQSGDADPTPLESHTHASVTWTKSTTSGWTGQLEIKSADNELSVDDGIGNTAFQYRVTAPASISRIIVSVRNDGTPIKTNINRCNVGWRWAGDISYMCVNLIENAARTDVTVKLVEWDGVKSAERATGTASVANALDTLKEIIITETTAGTTTVDATSIDASLFLTWSGVSTQGDDTIFTIDNYIEQTEGIPSVSTQDEHMIWESLTLYSSP